MVQVASGVRVVTWVVAATDSGNLANLNMTTGQSLGLARRIGERLRETGLELNGIVSFALGDPVEGDVPVVILRWARLPESGRLHSDREKGRGY